MATKLDTPNYVTIMDWVKRTGISRARTYELMAENILQSRKVGSRTLLDFNAGLAWIDAQPSADVKPRFKPKAKFPKKAPLT